MEDDCDRMTAPRNAFLSGALLVEILTGRSACVYVYSSSVSSEVTFNCEKVGPNLPLM